MDDLTLELGLVGSLEHSDLQTQHSIGVACEAQQIYELGYWASYMRKLSKVYRQHILNNSCTALYLQVYTENKLRNGKNL
jgi:hypothetical protein